MRITRRQMLTGTVALPALASLASCGSRPVEPAPGASGMQDATLPTTALTIGLTYIPNVQFSPFYVARDAGLFTDRGLDVTLRHHGVQEDSFGALLGNKEDIVFASGDEAMVASVTGTTIATFGTGFQQFPGVLLAAADSGITSVDDLRGKTIGMPGHFGSSYYTVLAALHLAGLNDTDVTLQDIGFTQVTALTTGRVDVVVGYSNNETVQFANAGFDVVEIVVQDPERPTLVGPGLTTIPGNLEIEVLSRVKEAVLEAEKLIVADPDVAIEATRAEVPTLSGPGQEDTARAVLAATATLWLRDGEPSLDVDTAAFDRMGELLVEVGIIEAAPTAPTVAV